MRRRLILGAAYVLLVVIVGLSVPFGFTLGRRLVEDLGGRVEREAFAVSASVEDRIEQQQSSGLQALAMRAAREVGGRVLITDASGALLGDSLQAPGPTPPSYASRPEIAKALRGIPNWQVRHSSTLGYDLLVSAVPIRSLGRVLGAVRLSYPMAQVRSAIRRSWWFLGVIGAFTLAVGLTLAAWLARWLTRPLGAATSVARRMAEGDLAGRVPDEGPPEVRELAAGMNHMADRVSDLLRANREFAANASHQLRTPLSALRLSLEEALEGAEPHGEIEHALEQTDRLTSLVESLLSLGQSRERGSDEVDLRAVADAVVRDVPADGIVMEVLGAGRSLGDARRVREVLANLVDNARRYAQNRVRVTVTSSGDQATLTVEDDGPGVLPEERARVFDRFYRSRGTRGSGSGLGLAMARELAGVDGGSVELSEGDLGGASFVVTYPAPVKRRSTAQASRS